MPSELTIADAPLLIARLYEFESWSDLAAVIARPHGLNVTHLHAPGSRQLTDAGLKTLTKLPRLAYLKLNGTGVTDRGLEVS